MPVWILDGDGSLAMQLGSLVTIANAAPPKFVHIVFHNGVYETSGAQPLPAEGRVSFAAMAEGAGYATVVRFDDVEAFDAELDDLLEADGPVLIELITQPAGSFYQPGPRPRSRPRVRWHATGPRYATRWEPTRPASDRATSVSKAYPIRIVDSGSGTIRFSIRPIFSISIRTTSPATRNLGGSKPIATPLGVPVATTSPAAA